MQISCETCLQARLASRILRYMQTDEQILGYRFKDRTLQQQALTHPSYLNETRNPGSVDYQRLEFLGDAVLGLLLAELLFQAFPDLPEGTLSRMRSALVDQASLAEHARTAELAPMILMGRGAEQEGGRSNPSILSDVFEALIGAIYCDAGFSAAQAVVTRIYQPVIAALAENHSAINDAKSELQELLAAQKRSAPAYLLVGQEGPDHDRLFRVSVTVDGVTVAEGEGRSKKAAQQAAARSALLQLKS